MTRKNNKGVPNVSDKFVVYSNDSLEELLTSANSLQELEAWFNEHLDDMYCDYPEEVECYKIMCPVEAKLVQHPAKVVITVLEGGK